MPTLSTHDPHRYAVRSPSQSGGPRKVRPSASLPPLAITREASFLQMTASSASTAQYGHANTTECDVYLLGILADRQALYRGYNLSVHGCIQRAR